MHYRDFLRAYAKAMAPLSANWMRDAAAEWNQLKAGAIEGGSWKSWYQQRFRGPKDYAFRAATGVPFLLMPSNVFFDKPSTLSNPNPERYAALEEERKKRIREGRQ
jgi:hypothetical protein